MEEFAEGTVLPVQLNQTLNVTVHSLSFLQHRLQLQNIWHILQNILGLYTVLQLRKENFFSIVQTAETVEFCILI
jgi:hypothetical protein